jgi:hypothetical protein
MSDAKKKNAGETMLEFLRAKGKKARKAGQATTEELAAAAGIPVKQAYDRLWWMEKKDGTLVSQGTGKNRTWRTTPKVRKPAEAKAPKAPKAVASPISVVSDASEEE